MFSNLVLRRACVMLLIPLITLSVFLGLPTKTSAHSDLDQFVVEADGYFRFLTHAKVGQTFRPGAGFNKLDGLGVYSGIQPAGPASCTLSVTLFKNTDMVNPIAHRSTTIYKMEAYTIIDIPAVTVIPDARYTMYATASSPYAYWLAKMSDVYPRGTSIIDSVADPSIDFVFATFGYNVEPPAQPAPIPEVDVAPTPSGGDAATVDSSGNSTDQSSTSTATTTPTTSTSILAPTALTATPATDGTARSIELKWTASKTSDITGYRIYRSVSETSGFTELGTVTKEVLTYKDEKAVASQAYFYAVRAYKDKTESKNSNIATATITDDTAPAAPANFKITSSNEEEIIFGWDKNIETDLANYVLTVAENENEDAKVLAEIDTIGKDETTYTLKRSEHELSVDTNYTFYLQAKDINTNHSEKATTQGMFAKEKTSNIWLWIGIGASAILVAGLIILFLILRKKKKKQEIS